MKKYCRYCSFCISGDCYYCTKHEKVLLKVDKIVNCKDFILSEMGDVDTGRQYKPQNRQKQDIDYEQLHF